MGKWLLQCGTDIPQQRASLLTIYIIIIMSSAGFEKFYFFNLYIIFYCFSHFSIPKADVVLHKPAQKLSPDDKTDIAPNYS